MKALVVALSLLICPSAMAQGILPSTVNSSRISARSPARYVVISPRYFATVASGLGERWIMPFSGRLVDIVINQASAGVGGTSFTLDVQNESSTSLLSTLPVQTVASGANQKTDVRGELALPSGWTRGVVKTDGTATITKGTRLSLVTVETGTYSTHATIVVALIFDPLE